MKRSSPNSLVTGLCMFTIENELALFCNAHSAELQCPELQTVTEISMLGTRIYPKAQRLELTDGFRKTGT